MGTRCRDVISIVARFSCPSNGSDDASTHCHFANTIVVKVGEVDITQSIYSNSIRITYLRTRRSDIISIVARRSCPGDCNNHASTHYHFSNTKVIAIGEVDITRSIYSNALRLIYLGTSRLEATSIVAGRSCPNNCSDDASTHCHFSNTIVIKVGEVDITISIYSNTSRLIYLGTRCRYVISIVARRSRPGNCSDDASTHCHFSDTMIANISQVDIA